MRTRAPAQPPHTPESGHTPDDAERRGASLDDYGDLLTVEEAGKVLRLSRNSAYAAVRRGEIPTLRFGRILRVPKAELAALIDRNGQQNG